MEIRPAYNCLWLSNNRTDILTNFVPRWWSLERRHIILIASEMRWPGTLKHLLERFFGCEAQICPSISAVGKILRNRRNQLANPSSWLLLDEAGSFHTQALIALASQSGASGDHVAALRFGFIVGWAERYGIRTLSRPLCLAEVGRWLADRSCPPSEANTDDLRAAELAVTINWHNLRTRIAGAIVDDMTSVFFKEFLPALGRSLLVRQLLGKLADDLLVVGELESGNGPLRKSLARTVYLIEATFDRRIQ